MPKWEWEALMAAVAIAAAFWRQVRGWLLWVRGWVLVTRRTDAYLGKLLLSYMHATMRTKPPADAGYTSAIRFVRPLNRAFRVIGQTFIGASQTFWSQWAPLWFTPHRSEGQGPAESMLLQFSFFRGTVNWEQLLLKAAVWEDAADAESTTMFSRNRTYHHYGNEYNVSPNDGTRRLDRNAAPVSDATSSHDGWGAHEGIRVLQWSYEDIQDPPVIATMDHLSLRPELQALTEELKFWLSSKEWYAEHGVPWRRGYLFHGAPGTGKTSYARATAQLLDLPVHVIDLTSMSNRDLQNAWKSISHSTPCMILLEDFDAVFEGRKNLTSSTSRDPLTFDAVLNCIDGIERNDGILVVMTTNNVTAMDPALVDRPGRIDKTVEFFPLDHHGRVKLALRILDDQAGAERLAMAHTDDSAAQFQERCFRIALERRFA